MLDFLFMSSLVINFSETVPRTPVLHINCCVIVNLLFSAQVRNDKLPEHMFNIYYSILEWFVY